MKVFNFFILIFLSVFTIRAQWSTDPNNNLIVGYGLDPHICSDSTGGCYITYDYENIYYPRKLALERLDKYGYKSWGTLKQILGELPEQSHAEIIEDGEGGVIVSYEDRFEDLPITEQRVRVQRVDSSGNFLWGTTGVKVTLEEINHGKQQLVTDGSGGAVVAWVNTLDQYKVNWISSAGQRMWGDSGLALTSGSSSQPIVIKATDGNYYIQAGTIIYRINQNGEIRNQYSSTTFGQPVPDPEGGVVLSGRVWNGMIPKLVSQRKDSLGNNLWQEPYVEIADSLYINTRLLIQNNKGYYYYGWSGDKNGISRVAQYQALRFDGTKLFPEGSISLSDNTPITVAGIVSSDSSRTILIWNDATISSSTIAQMFDTLGNKLWDENDVMVSFPAIAFKNITDGQGGFITMGPIDQFTIVVQQVSKYGNLGEIITSISQEYQNIIPTGTILYQNFPNPFNSNTIIGFQLQKENEIKIDLYNVLGEKIQTIVDGYYSRGVHSFNFSSGELPSGIYLYRLVTESKSITKKLIIIK